MAGKSTLDPDNFAGGAEPRVVPKGHDVRSLGPSDSSDSGSDMAGGPIDALEDNSDSYGTGEHPAAEEAPDVRPNADIDTDRIIGADEAGLGGGLDEAEEAQLRAPKDE